MCDTHSNVCRVHVSPMNIQVLDKFTLIKSPHKIHFSCNTQIFICCGLLFYDANILFEWFICDIKMYAKCRLHLVYVVHVLGKVTCAFGACNSLRAGNIQCHEERTKSIDRFKMSNKKNRLLSSQIFRDSPKERG